MRILDQNDNEISELDVDTSLGYLQEEQLYKDTTPAQPEVEEKFHYQVKTWYFMDGTTQDVTSNDDPSVKVVDDQAGVFEYVGSKQYKGADLDRIVDVKHKDAVEEKKNYETIQRYVMYTPDELKARQEEQEREQKQADFMENGPDQLSSNTSNINDLTVMISELVGSEE